MAYYDHNVSVTICKFYRAIKKEGMVY